jgi:hypothetical protein
MKEAVENARTELPPELAPLFDSDQLVPCKVDPEQLEIKQKKVNLAEMMRGKTAEDLLELEWGGLQRAEASGTVGKDGKAKVSEGRVQTLIDGTMDIPTLEHCEEMADLQQLSLQLQSLLYASLSQNLRPYDATLPTPDRIGNTEVAILVDISAAMTTMAPGKLMAAQILAVGLSTTLSTFGIPLAHFAFGDREAIWYLTEPGNLNTPVELLRIVDSLRAGGRTESYPVDAILSVQNNWLSRRDRRQGTAENHLTIVISDFISVQVLDKKRNWSEMGLGQCILLALNTEWNQQVLSQTKVPLDAYETGLCPNFNPSVGSIRLFRLNPTEICSGIPGQASILPEIVGAVVSSVITKTSLQRQIGPVIIGVRPPKTDPNPAWGHLGKTSERSEDRANDVFFQGKSSQQFPLMLLPGEGSKSTIQVQVSDHLEGSREWLNRTGGYSGPNPFEGRAKDIATMALTHSFVPNLAAGKEPSSSSGELWIDGLRRFIASGYTYPYLFRKKSRRNQKAYAITILFDSACRLFSSFNAYHTISTTAALLGALPLVPESDDIVVDVISATSGQVNLLLSNTPVRHLADGGMVSDLLHTIEQAALPEGGLGAGCQAALQIAARRSGVGLGRRIFVLTDGIITSPSELFALRSALVDCESTGIDVLGIGLGIAPIHLPELFPLCLYAPNPADLGIATSAALGFAGPSSSAAISSRQIYHGPEQEALQQIRDRLCKAGPVNCPGLGASIHNQPLAIDDFLATLGDSDLLVMKNDARHLTANSEKEPWDDGLFAGFRILVVCLVHFPPEITRAVFEAQCGRVMKRKGFDYTYASSYGEGINELTRNVGGRCPYTQLWLICSDGYGAVLNEATDKNPHKFVPFVRAVTDFWSAGGGLMLFADNTPFTFEANYLLENCLNFPNNGRTQRSNVRFSGEWDKRAYINVGPADAPAVKTFTRKTELPPPGRCPVRVSLRPGLVTFFEGITIAAAVNSSRQPLSSESELWPFTPFAWTSEPAANPRPFILFYDPKIPPGQTETAGPIVLHGGFTSAFCQFGDDKTGGTGRLIISIACWLTRIEERMYQAKCTGNPMVKTVPALTGSYVVAGNFTGFTGGL